MAGKYRIAIAVISGATLESKRADRPRSTVSTVYYTVIYSIVHANGAFSGTSLTVSVLCVVVLRV